MLPPISGDGGGKTTMAKEATVLGEIESEVWPVMKENSTENKAQIVYFSHGGG
jgi:hypothetical protein